MHVTLAHPEGYGLMPEIGHIAWADWGAFETMIAAGERAARSFFGERG